MSINNHNKNGFFTDAFGGKSSKRLIGFFLVLIGTIFLVTLGACSFFFIIPAHTIILEVGFGLIGAGGGFIIGGTFDNYARSKLSILGGKFGGIGNVNKNT
jgi:hypothetical protein